MSVSLFDGRPIPTPYAPLLDVSLSKSINDGNSWSKVSGTNINQDNCPPTGTDCDNDREYLWTDHNPTSAYYGRTYLTEVVSSRDEGFISNHPTYWAVGLRYTTDNGNSWSPFVVLNNPADFNSLVAEDEFPSLAIEPNGTIVEVWRHGRCCGEDQPGPHIDTGTVEEWARSTDGGQTFSAAQPIHTTSKSHAIIWNDTSPNDPGPNGFGGFRWSDAPNVTADPVDGTLYAVWAEYRGNYTDKITAGVYLSRGIDLGQGDIVWSDPVLVDNSAPNKYQFFPWVQVSKERATGSLYGTVRVTYGAAAPSGTLNRQVVQYYVESTNGGQTFSQPYPLSVTAFYANSFMGDYNADSTGGYDGSNGRILTAWTDTSSGAQDRWGRVGTFPQVEPTATICPIQFADVPQGSTFYPFIRCLACRGVISGYPGDPNYTNPCIGKAEEAGQTYFRPCVSASRGQVSKIIANAAYFNDPIPSSRQTFEDVPVGSPFWVFIERLSERNVIGGYPCHFNPPGGPEYDDVCVPPANRPYFHPERDTTRGQISKVVANAAGFEETIPQSQQTYQDITPTGDAFWLYIERLSGRQIVGGYPCNASNYNVCIGGYEGCVQPQQRPYFRSCNVVTRGEIAKIVANSFAPSCVTREGLGPDKPALPATGTTTVPVSTPTFAATAPVSSTPATSPTSNTPVTSPTSGTPSATRIPPPPQTQPPLPYSTPVVPPPPPTAPLPPPPARTVQATVQPLNP